jgi:hypothetical protein
MSKASAAKVLVTAATMLFSFGASRSSSPFKLIPVKLRRNHPLTILRHPRNGFYTSSNWSGYAVTGNNGSVTSVSGSWVVPTATCSSSPNGYAAFWVGIDGFSSNTVEQIGTDSDCVNLQGTRNNTPTYYAWFEFYPKGSYVIQFPFNVQPNDIISATVTYNGPVSNPRHGGSGGQFTVTLTDVTRNPNLTFTTTSVVNGAQESSAEWIAEAPCCGSHNSVLPLADFGTVNFGNAASNVSGAISGDGSNPNLQEIRMEDQGSTVIKAQPSPATSGAFSVTWLDPGP